MIGVESLQNQVLRWTNTTLVPSCFDPTRVTVRRVQNGDLALVMEMHERLSKESTYNRYLAARRPTARALEYLCSLEGETGAAFVATVQESGEKVIAMACYGVDPDNPATAEPAILVEDSYQGGGVGKRMLWELYEEAKRNGLEVFVCYAHPANQRVLRLIEGCGLPSESRYTDGLIEVRVWLKPGLRGSYREIDGEA